MVLCVCFSDKSYTVWFVCGVLLVFSFFFFLCVCVCVYALHSSALCCVFWGFFSQLAVLMYWCGICSLSVPYWQTWYCGSDLYMAVVGVCCKDRPCGVNPHMAGLYVCCIDIPGGNGPQMAGLCVCWTDRACGVGPQKVRLSVCCTDRFGTAVVAHICQFCVCCADRPCDVGPHMAGLCVCCTDRFGTVLLVHTWQDYVFAVQIDLELCYWSTHGRTMCLLYR